MNSDYAYFLNRFPYIKDSDKYYFAQDSCKFLDSCTLADGSMNIVKKVKTVFINSILLKFSSSSCEIISQL